MNFFPKISIVTPSLNQGKYIEQTILSIISQGYPNLEYIIIDGGSTDNTVEIIKQYEQDITYWISEPDNGQSDAINKGLAKCTGDIFNWINSDDYLEKNTLFVIAEYFKTNPAVDIVCGFCSLFNEDASTQAFTHRTEIFTTLEETLVKQRINQPASFYKLKIINQLGGLNNDFHFIMDLDVWFRYLAANGQKKILLINELLAHFRIHTHSKTVQLQEKFREEEKLLWFHFLDQLSIMNPLINYFKSEKNYSHDLKWDCNAVNKQKLIDSICKYYLFDFYKAKKWDAAKFSFLNQLKQGNIRLQRNYAGMFYNLFLKIS